MLLLLLSVERGSERGRMETLTLWWQWECVAQWMNERQRAQLGFGESSRPATATAATATVQPVYNAQRQTQFVCKFHENLNTCKNNTHQQRIQEKNKKQAQKKRGQKQLNKTRHQSQKRATVRRARQLDTHHPLFYRTGTISKVTWTTSDWIEIYRKGGYAVLVNLVVKKVLIFGYQYNFLNNLLLRFYNFAMNYHYLTANNENNPTIIKS